MERNRIEGSGEQVPHFLEGISRHAEEVIDRERIDMHDFVDIYGEDAVAADNMRCVRKHDEIVHNMESNPAQLRQYINQMKWGTAVEGCLHHGINSKAFLASDLIDFCGIKTSEYDDLFNGTDEVVIATQKDSGGISHFGFGVDMTVGDPSRKVQRALQRVQAGKGTTLKYFQSNVPGFQVKGQLETPSVTLAVDKRNLREMLAKWHEGELDTYDSGPLQMLMMRQIADQLDAQLTVAGRARQSGSEKEKLDKLMAACTHAKGFAEKMISELRGNGVRMGELRNDPNHLRLNEYLASVIK